MLLAFLLVLFQIATKCMSIEAFKLHPRDFLKIFCRGMLGCYLSLKYLKDRVPRVISNAANVLAAAGILGIRVSTVSYMRNRMWSSEYLRRTRAEFVNGE